MTITPLRLLRFRHLILLLLLGCMAACKSSHKKSMKGDEEVTTADFVSFFDPVKLPFAFTDTIFKNKLSDSARIEYSVFTKILGDTILKPQYKKEKPKIYALGRFQNAEAETYLLVQTKGTQNAMYLIAVDNNMQPKASMLLLANKGKPAEVNLVSIDKKMTITLVDEYKKSNGENAAYSTVYAYNNAGLFMVIMNDGLKKGEVIELVNPIDTFPQTQPHTGDFGNLKQSFISIRDGETPKKFQFFLYMNKSSLCTAELKGEARWVTKDSAVYDSNNDGCKVAFKFGKRNVQILELEGCGSKRPLECSFNASYSKIQKPAASKKKKK